MIAALINKTEIKLYILYVMKHIGYPIAYDKLNDTVTADGAVNYFGFAECFSELLETSNISVKETEEGKEGFVITEQGINVVDTLIDSLPSIVRRTALAAATRLTSFEKRGAAIERHVTDLPDGKFLFTFRVTEYNKETFSLSVTLETREQLNLIKYNLEKDPDGVYKCIMALLSGQANYLLDSTL